MFHSKLIGNQPIFFVTAPAPKPEMAIDNSVIKPEAFIPHIEREKPGVIIRKACGFDAMTMRAFPPSILMESATDRRELVPDLDRVARADTGVARTSFTGIPSNPIDPTMWACHDMHSKLPVLKYPGV